MKLKKIEFHNSFLQGIFLNLGSPHSNRRHRIQRILFSQRNQFYVESLRSSHGSGHVAGTGSLQPIMPSDGRRENHQKR